jgi:hypothetical protein
VKQKKAINSAFAAKCRGCKRPLPMKTVEDKEGGHHLRPDNDWGCIFCADLVCGNCYTQHTEEKHT